MLSKDQDEAQAGDSSFEKMITTTNDIAGKEIYESFKSSIQNLMPQLSLIQNMTTKDPKKVLKEFKAKLKALIAETTAKLKILLELSKAASLAGEVMQKMRVAGMDDSEINEIFASFTTNMDTSISDYSQFTTEKDIKNELSEKMNNISKNCKTEDLENKQKICEQKIKEEKAKLKSTTLTIEEKTECELKLQGYKLEYSLYKDLNDILKAYIKK